MRSKIKQCACGCSYSQSEWLSLPFAYREHFDADEFGPRSDAEFRHCRCGSTIGIDVDFVEDPKETPWRLRLSDEAYRRSQAFDRHELRRVRRSYAFTALALLGFVACAIALVAP